MKKILTTLFLLRIALIGSAQTEKSIEATIRALDALEAIAFIKQDYAALDTLWASDLKVNSPRNTISLSAAETGGFLKKGLIKHFLMERNIEQLFVKDNMVVVMGNEVVKNTATEPAYKRRFSNFWIKQDNSWKLTFRHANIIGDVQLANTHPTLQEKELEIRRLENLETEAILKGDSSALFKIWSPNMVVHNPVNKVITMEEVKMRLGTGQLDYSSFERTIEKITFDDNVAIVMGEEKLRPQGIANHKGKLVTRRFTNIWKYTNGTWLQIARQATIIKVE